MNSYREPMNLTVRHLQMLVAAADLGSFSRAAEQMGISQPAFSEGIRKIEEEVGCRLFNRTTRSFDLTADGRHIVATARELVRDFKLALESIRTGAGSRGRISVAALPSVVASVMPRALRQFAERFPQVDVVIHDVLQERAVAMVLDGIADIGVATSMAKLEGLRFAEVAPDEFLAVFAAGHKLLSRTRVRWRDLAEFPFVALSGLSSIRRVTDAAFLNAEASPVIRCDVEQILSAIALVEADHGVTALPSIARGMFLGRNVAVRPLIDPVGHRRIGIVTLARRQRSPAVLYMAGVLEDCIRTVLAGPLADPGA